MAKPRNQPPKPEPKPGPVVTLEDFVLVRDPVAPEKVAVVRVTATVDVTQGELVCDGASLAHARTRMATRRLLAEEKTAKRRLEPIEWPS